MVRDDVKDGNGVGIVVVVFVFLIYFLRRRFYLKDVLVRFGRICS